MPRPRKRGVEQKYVRLKPGQREHLERVARFLASELETDYDWHDVIMDTLEDFWPMSMSPARAEKMRRR